MQVHVIDLSSWTASFRYPNLISGVQPTLEVPPVSTVLGLLNAAAGQYLHHQKLEIGYYFQFDAKAVDLESIYQIDSTNGRATNNAKSNIIRREFLFNTRLRIYLTDPKLADYFRQPYYSLVLGRMNDLATVEQITTLDLPEVAYASRLAGQVIPFRENYLAGQIQALPKYFTDTFPRQNVGTEPYSVISHLTFVKANLPAIHDKNLGKAGTDIYLHQLDFSEHDQAV
ncbi:type I-B CRISPR-associated protein Cas5b [Siphonobacter curvatus]|uniref:Type I-B CRISPR-associated protein Cas5 n=1 Tax=Siphonobacter curvatus TaxID=2094562 RepID=A0A2S7IGW5_9BACT|nr:type I-B CRISPR-associated protein Cas5b [Siphonobacter curvatus]PQA55032.1 type I-B CRISPR-associated protein Cas5 [Siphonobacter curvatus]